VAKVDPLHTDSPEYPPSHWDSCGTPVRQRGSLRVSRMPVLGADSPRPPPTGTRFVRARISSISNAKYFRKEPEE